MYIKENIKSANSPVKLDKFKIKIVKFFKICKIVHYNLHPTV